jgi:hypothetical protein
MHCSRSPCILLNRLQYSLLPPQNSPVLSRVVLELHFDHVRHWPYINEHFEFGELRKGLPHMVSINLIQMIDHIDIPPPEQWQGSFRPGHCMLRLRQGGPLSGPGQTPNNTLIMRYCN